MALYGTNLWKENILIFMTKGVKLFTITTGNLWRDQLIIISSYMTILSNN